MGKLISPKAGLLAAVAALSLFVASMASGELVQEGNFRISFHGGIAPEKLPRNELAPVGVQIGAKIKTVDRTKPPRLAEITLDINANGVIDAKGLPTCPFAKLRNAKADAARQACGDAEVGHGNVTTRVEFPGQGPFSAPGTLIAFNAKEKGKQAIFAYVDSTGKFSTTFVIKFIVKKTKGTYGTSLVAEVPPIASGSGYISAFDLSLKRRYSLRGEKRSYMSASCPLPAGIATASFPLVRSTYGFEDEAHTEVVSVLTRQCRVRG